MEPSSSANPGHLEAEGSHGSDGRPKTPHVNVNVTSGESLLSYRIGPSRVPPDVLRLRNVYSSPKVPDATPTFPSEIQAEPGSGDPDQALTAAQRTGSGDQGRAWFWSAARGTPAQSTVVEEEEAGTLGLSRSQFAKKAQTFEKQTVDDLKPKGHGLAGTLILSYYTIGMIYGDIGTSPLYTISGILGSLSYTPSEVDLLGAASLCFWFLTLSPLIKYVFIVLYADDLGEGGTFAVYSNLCRHARISLLGSRTNRPEENALVRNYTNASAESPSRVLDSSADDHGSDTHGSDRGGNAAGGDRSGAPAREASSQSVGQGDRTSSSMRPEPMAKWLPRGAARCTRALIERHWWIRQALLVLALIGTCGVLADGVLTPAVSVLSAVQGLGEAGASLANGPIVGITCAILIVLFCIQPFGTTRISWVFSPVVLLWFFTIASIGIYNIVTYMPGVFKAISPWYAFNILVTNGFNGWLILGQALLCITGSEAMFADMGHFSRLSIQIAFSCIVYPSVILAYFGQTAFLSQNIEDIPTAFYSSTPEPLFWPVFVVATGAAVVASQAMISGAFSVIKQSMAVSCFPRIRIFHTSRTEEGQIYIPLINWTLMVLTVAVTAGFQNGTAITNAYGVTVAMVMIVTTTLVSTAMLVSWNLSLWLVLPFWLFYTVFEGALFSATLYKVPTGGWFPLAVSAILLFVMFTWHFGTYKKKHFTMEHDLGEKQLYPLLEQASCVDGVAVVYSEVDEGVPPVLVHFLANVPALQKVVICLTVKQLPVPRLEEQHRMLIAPMAYMGERLPGFYRVIVYYGYVEQWDHGPEFLSDLRTALLRSISEQAKLETLRTQILEAKPSAEEEVEPLHQTWKLPEPGAQHPQVQGATARKLEKELEVLDSAWEYNQVFFMGRTSVKAAKDAQLATHALIRVYTFIKGLTASKATSLGVPTDRLLEVGMCYVVK